MLRIPRYTTVNDNRLLRTKGYAYYLCKIKVNVNNKNAEKTWKSLC